MLVLERVNRGKRKQTYKPIASIETVQEFDERIDPEMNRVPAGEMGLAITAGDGTEAKTTGSGCLGIVDGIANNKSSGRSQAITGSKGSGGLGRKRRRGAVRRDDPGKVGRKGQVVEDGPGRDEGFVGENVQRVPAGAKGRERGDSARLGKRLAPAFGIIVLAKGAFKDVECGDIQARESSGEDFAYRWSDEPTQIGNSGSTLGQDCSNSGQRRVLDTGKGINQSTVEIEKYVHGFWRVQTVSHRARG